MIWRYGAAGMCVIIALAGWFDEDMFSGYGKFVAGVMVVAFLVFFEQAFRRRHNKRPGK